MRCKWLFGVVTVSFVMAAAGCGEPEAPRTNDAPVKAAEGKTKRGKATKTVDLSIELPASEVPGKK